MIRLIGIVFIVLFSINALAQPGKAKVELIDNVKYYAHYVQNGQTLYGIHQLYDVPVDEIIKSNNNIESGLKIGQKVLIPISTENPRFYAKHTVKKKETLYGISRKYKCKVEELYAINPSLNGGGIKVGQEIVVSVLGQENNVVEHIIEDPILENINTNQKKPNTSFDSIINHTVLEHETLYSISKRYMVTTQSIKDLNSLKNNTVKKGDILKIKIKRVNYQIGENPIANDSLIDSLNLSQLIVKKEKYKVALFLPLMLSKNQAYINKPLKVGQVKELYPVTKVSSGFYHGFLLAADSLSKAGMNVEVFVYDTKKDTAVIKKQLNKMEFKSHDFDAFIGPFYPKTINYLADYCKRNKINLIIPFNAESKVLYENPYIYKTTVSNMTLITGAVDFIVENYAHYNVSILKSTVSSDLPLYEKAREEFNTKILLKENAMNSKIIELSMEGGSKALGLRLRKDTVNVIIVPSTNLKYVVKVFRALNDVVNRNSRAKNMKIIVFGLEDWNKFKDLDLAQRNILHQHYASYRYLDYDEIQTKKMILSYRTKYGTDPNKYAVQGFDVGYYFLSAMYLYGENYTQFLENYKVDLIQNSFKFDTKDLINGHENGSINIIEYDNFKLYKRQ